ncbi:unnamed protein product [Oikopleura dioica]|uniref:Uncharacterized protein n=1 Tax=Oikopleura dioica TaxID=34765 RepID=E4WT52_OIKDI|nr:unnamed protein product [Oikopleura dioica]
MFRRLHIIRPNVRVCARFHKSPTAILPKNRFDGTPLPKETSPDEKNARKPSLTRKKKIRNSFIAEEGISDAQNHPLLQNMIDEKPKEEFSMIDDERSRQMAFRNSDFGYLVTTNRGKSENFDYNGNYRGNQHIQSNLYWKEAAEIEDEMTPEIILANFRKLLSSLDNVFQNLLEERWSAIRICFTKALVNFRVKNYRNRYNPVLRTFFPVFLT